MIGDDRAAVREGGLPIAQISAALNGLSAANREPVACGVRENKIVTPIVQTHEARASECDVSAQAQTDSVAVVGKTQRPVVRQRS